MAKYVLATVSMALVVTACAQPRPPEPPRLPVWSAQYAVPVEVMTTCLSTSPAGAATASAPVYGLGGVPTIAFVPANMPQLPSEFVVLRIPNNGTQVNWRRPDNVGGLDWLDAEARARANRCGNFTVP